MRPKSETHVTLVDEEVGLIRDFISEKDIEIEYKLPILGNLNWLEVLFR